VSVSKRRLVLCHCLVLLDLFGDCFLFILVVCLYVLIVDRRERFMEGFEDKDVQEFEQQSCVEGKSSLMHTRLSYITCI
jgi:hypothetical protein